MTSGSHDRTPESHRIRRIQPGDAPALMRFYNGLSDRSKRLFRPIGLKTDLETCEGIVHDNGLPGGKSSSQDPCDTGVSPVGIQGLGVGAKYDLVATVGDEVVGWCFIWGLRNDEPSLGLGVADAHQSRGVGRSLMSAVMSWAREHGIPVVHLIVVRENEIARRLYEAFGFIVTGERISQVDGLPYWEMKATLSSPGD